MMMLLLMGDTKNWQIFQKKYDYWQKVILYSTFGAMNIAPNPMRYDWIGEATIAINIKFSSIMIVLNVNSNKS